MTVEDAIRRASGEGYDEVSPVEIRDLAPDVVRALLTLAEDACDSGEYDEDGAPCFAYTMCGVDRDLGHWHLTAVLHEDLYSE